MSDSPSMEAAPKGPEEPMLADGRQSQRALMIRRGAGRFLAQGGAVCLYEASLANGRRADIVALMPDGLITIVEVKSSPADLRADGKWPDYLDFCDRFLFATAPDVPQEIFPGEEGLMIADGYGAHVVREPNIRKLHASRRKALTLRLARLAIGRLHHLDAPQAQIPER
ncbi:MAG: MmcB family DNA repair protein [Cohaesibacteraceae bacterium]